MPDVKFKPGHEFKISIGSKNNTRAAEDLYIRVEGDTYEHQVPNGRPKKRRSKSRGTVRSSSARGGGGKEKASRER